MDEHPWIVSKKLLKAIRESKAKSMYVYIVRRSASSLEKFKACRFTNLKNLELQRNDQESHLVEVVIGPFMTLDSLHYLKIFPK